MYFYDLFARVITSRPFWGLIRISLAVPEFAAADHFRAGETMKEENMKASPKAVWIYLFYLIFFLANILLFSIDQVFYKKYFWGEDRLIEWLTCIGFFWASLICLGILIKFNPLMNRWALFYLTGFFLFFFVCAGEEISWGQRLLGFQTPEVLLEHNQQEEFNIHNLDLKLLHPRDIMGVYVYLFGIFLPLFFFFQKSTPAATWRLFIYTPAIALCFIWAEMLNLGREPFSSFIEHRVNQETFDLITNQIEETVEMYWGLSALFGMIGIKEAWDRLHFGEYRNNRRNAAQFPG